MFSKYEGIADITLLSRNIRHSVCDKISKTPNEV